MNALILNDLLLWLNRCNFDCVVSIILFSQSIILWPNSSLYQNSFNLLCIIIGYILWVVAICTIFIGEVNKPIRGFSIENRFAYFRINLFELSRMISPIWSWKEEFSKGLFRTLWNKFSVSKGFIVSIIVDHCRNVNQDLLQWNLIEGILQSFNS